MFRKSFVLVLLILAVVFSSAFASQMFITSQLPSSYDPGLSVMQAFQTAKTPLLIEFYSDDCSTCKKVTPLLHNTYNKSLKSKLTLVMVDVNAPENEEVARLFGIEQLPSIFVFDFKHMKKQEIDIQSLASAEGFQKAVTNAFDIINRRAASGVKGTPPAI